MRKRSLGWPQWMLLSGFFVVLACWVTWPVVRAPDRWLPTGDTPIATVPMLNTWTIWWNAQALRGGLTNYWDAPIFFPVKGALAFSEPQPASMAVAPLVWFVSPVAAYNVYLWGSLVLNGIFGARLLLYLRTGRLIAAAGGAAILLHPLALKNLEASQLVPMWGVLLSIEYSFRLHSDQRLRDTIGLALGLTVTAYTCIHHALMWGIILPFALACLAFFSIGPGAGQRLFRMFSLFLVATGAAALLIAPIVLPMQRILRQHELSRSRETVAALSASFADWKAVPSNALLSWESRSQRPLLPGVVRTVMSVAAIALMFRRRRMRPAVTFLIVMAVTSCLLSLGPGLSLAGLQPWELARTFEPLTRMRSIYRFAYFTQLSILLLAALGAADFVSRVRVLTRRSHRLGRWISMAVGCAMAMVIGLEVVPNHCFVRVPPGRSQEPGWVDFLRKNVAKEQSVLCLPMAKGNSESDMEQEAIWMMFGTLHAIPLVNGYSGFIPKEFFRLARETSL